MTGLSPSETVSNMKLFAYLSNTELCIQPDPVVVKRLGHPELNLFWSTLSKQIKRNHLSDPPNNCKRSSNPAVQDKIFINLNLTKADATA